MRFSVSQIIFQFQRETTVNSETHGCSLVYNFFFGGGGLKSASYSKKKVNNVQKRHYNTPQLHVTVTFMN